MLDEYIAEPASSDAPTAQRAEELNQKLQTFFNRIAGLAQGISARLRLLLLLDLLSAGWLTFFVFRLFEPPPWQLLSALLLFSLPALLILRLRNSVQAVIALPDMLADMGDHFNAVLAKLRGDTVGRLNNINNQEDKPVNIKELIGMGRQLLGMGKLLAELKEFGRAEVIEAMIMLTTPAFVLLTGIATVSTLVLAVLACLTAVVYWLNL